VTAASRPDWFGDHNSAARSSRGPLGPVVGVVAVGLAAFLAVTVTAGLLVWNADAPADIRDGSTRSLGGTGSGATVGVPHAQLERNTRTARIGTASLVLPDDPYVVHPEPLTRPGLFDDFFWAAATVHPRYDTRRDWSSTMLLGRLSGGSLAGDLDHDGRRVLDQMSAEFFDGHETTVRHLDAADHAVDGHPGMLFNATVHYSVPNLTSRYDTMSALLVRLDDGTVVVAATSVPDDTDPALAQQAADALRSLRIQ
jgi:hypothetical protein